MASEPFLIAALSDVIGSLSRRGVEYALAGGWAYSALVEPRATTDVDLLILLQDPSPGKIAELFSSVFESIVPHSAPVSFKDILIWRVVGIRNNRESIVDPLLARSDFLRNVLARKKTIDFLGMALPIITVILKTIAGLLQDHADIERIRQRQSVLGLHPSLENEAAAS